MRDEDNTYDNKFENTDPYKVVKRKSTSNNMFSTVPRGGYNSTTKNLFFDNKVKGNFFDSIFLDEYDNPIYEDENKEKVAHRQPWVAKASAGIARVGVKVASEIAKMPGALGGIVAGSIGQVGDLITGEDNTDFIKTAFDNSWINAVQDAEEHIKEDYLPVYVKKAVQEGNLWDNITSIDFWATEGADGIGYIASMLAPGAAISKLNIGNKLIGASKLAKMTRGSENAQKALKAIGYTPKNANVFSATIANTLFEAGAESKGAMDSFKQGEKYQELLATKPELIEKYKNELLEQYRNGEYEADVKYDAEGNPSSFGIPSEAEIMQEIDGKASEMADKEIADVVGSVGQRAFLTNLAILLGPNAITSKILHGKGARNAIKNNSLDVNKKGLLEYTKNTTKQKIGEGAKQFVKGGAREGFFEEGMQSASEEYYTHNPDKGLLDFGMDIGGAYLDMLGSVDGQKAIFLGAVFGGGMNVINNVLESRKEDNRYEQLVALGNKSLDDFYSETISDVYKTEEGPNGEQKIIYEQVENANGEIENKPVIDENKVFQKLENLKSINETSFLYDMALAKGDEELVKTIQDQYKTSLVLPFIVNDELGMSLLKEHLDNTTKLNNLPKEIIKDPEAFKQDILDKAQFIKDKRDLASEMTYTFLNLKNDASIDVNDKLLFENNQLTKYSYLLGQQYDVNKKIDLINSKYEQALANVTEVLNSELKKDRPYIDNSNIDNYAKQEKINEKALENPIVKNYADELKKLNKKKSIIDKQSRVMFSDKNTTKDYKDFKNKLKKHKEELAKEEEVSKVKAQIENATEETELDNIESPTESVNQEIGNLVAKKRAEIKARKAKEEAAIRQKEEEYNNAEEEESFEEEETNNEDSSPKKELTFEERQERDLDRFLNRVVKGNKVGKKVFIPNVISPRLKSRFSGAEAIITSIKNGKVNIKLTDGSDYSMSIAIPNGAKTPVPTSKANEKPLTRNVESENPNLNELNEDEVDEYIENTVDNLDKEEEKDLNNTSKYKPVHTRIIITDNKKGSGEKMFDNIPDEAVEYERTPVNKIGEKKHIEVNEGVSNTQVEKVGVIVEAKFTGQGTNFELEIKGENKPFLLVWNRNKSIPSLWGKKQKDGSYTTTDTSPSKQSIQKLVDKYVPKNLLNLLNKWTESSKLPAEQVLDAQALIEKEITVEVNALNSTEQSVNASYLTANQQKTVEMFNNKDFSDLELLINHLPLNIKLTDGIAVPLETLPSTKEAQDTFNKTAKILRKAIIKEIALNNTNINDIQIEIAGQYNGELQLDGNNENNIVDLYDFQSDINNITSDLLYVGITGDTMENVEGDSTYINSKSIGRGEIYIKIKTAKGTDFPLKLNIKRTSTEKANILYDIYGHYIDNNMKINETTLISNLSEDLQNSIKDILDKEIKVYEDNKIPYDKLTTRNLIDVLIWDGSKNDNTKVTFDDNNFIIGTTKISLDEFNNSESKDKIVTFLETKRQNILFKEDLTNPLSLSNKSYINYLVENKILNTNAKVNQHTFAGKTTMYVDTSKVLINGKNSEYAQKVVYKPAVRGTSNDLNEKLPDMKKNEATLDEESKAFYTTKNGVKHDRVSSLKGKVNETKAMAIGGKRGDVVDDALRIYFSKKLSLENFVKEVKNSIKNVNEKRPDNPIDFTDLAIEQLFEIGQAYELIFDKLNWTVYSNPNSLAGKIGNAGDYNGYFAGTMDFLVYDNNNGKWIDIDIKTSSETNNRVDAYTGVTKDKYNYVGKDRIQQNAYAELFKQTNNEELDQLYILPLTLSNIKDGDVYVFDTINMNADNNLLKVDNSKDIYELKNISKKSTSTKKTTEAPFNTKKDTVSISDTFVSIDEVNEGVLKIKSKEAIKLLNNDDVLYFIPNSNIILEQFSKNEYVPLVNINEVDNALYNHNKTSKDKIDKEKVKTSLRNRKNVVPLQNSKKEIDKEVEPKKVIKKVASIKKNVNLKVSDIIDFTNLTEDKAGNIIKSLRKSLTLVERKAVLPLLKNDNKVKSLENVINYLSEMYTVEELKTKCNIGN